MFNYLKKLFTTEKVTTQPVLNQELINQLNLIIYDRDCNLIFNDPVSKMYIINTYSLDFGDLLENITNKNFKRNMAAINIYAFFMERKVDLKYQLKGITTYLTNNRISTLVEHDLIEVVEAFVYLKNLKEK